MPKLNKTIIRSVVKDLRSLEKICNELRKHVLNPETMSWRYPPKMCHCIYINSILSEFNGSAYECYLLVLELMYDRFQYFLHLVIKYLDIFPVMPHTYHLPRNVVSPEYLSTGALLNMLWIRFQLLQKYFLDFVVEKANGNDGNSSQNVTLSLGAILSQSISEPTPTYHQSNFFNRNTQTEIFSLSKCECCCMSEEVIKFIIHEVQEQCSEHEIHSILAHARDNMKGEIFHITQWGAMSRWSDAIIYDLKEIFQALIRHTNSNKRLQESLAERERKIEESVSEIDDKIITLQEEIHSLQEQLQTEQIRADSLAQEKEELNLNLRKQTEEILQLHEGLRTSESALTKATYTNSSLETELQKIAYEFGINISNTKDYGDIIEKWRCFVSTFENEKMYLKKELQNLRQQLQENDLFLKDELAKRETIIKDEKEKYETMSTELQKMNEKVEESQDLICRNQQLQNSLKEAEQRIMILMKSNETLEKELEEKKVHEQLLIENPDITSKVEVKVHGNPEQDLENQIQANEIRIQLISVQTTKLKETLNKLRKLTKFRQAALTNA